MQLQPLRMASESFSVAAADGFRSVSVAAAVKPAVSAAYWRAAPGVHQQCVHALFH
jgi:hypothetical protein